MEIRVRQKDENGIITNSIHNLKFIQFIKHFGLAGQKYITTPGAIRRGMGLFHFFEQYWNIPNFNTATHFSLPQDDVYDPTEVNHFSNIVGKAVADFLAREIYDVDFTQNYEGAIKEANNIPGAIRIPLNRSRPDLYCISTTNQKQYAIEAKGRKGQTFSENSMGIVKTQSEQTHLNEDNSIASVTYGIYNNIRTKFYDPTIEGGEYNEELNRRIIQKFYSGYQELINLYNAFGDTREYIRKDQKFYHLPIYPYIFELNFFGFDPLSIWNNQFGLLIDKNILKEGKEGRFRRANERILDEKVYIDVDGIGIIQM